MLPPYLATIMVLFIHHVASWSPPCSFYSQFCWLSFISILLIVHSVAPARQPWYYCLLCYHWPPPWSLLSMLPLASTMILIVHHVVIGLHHDPYCPSCCHWPPSRSLLFIMLLLTSTRIFIALPMFHWTFPWSLLSIMLPLASAMILIVHQVATGLHRNPYC